MDYSGDLNFTGDVGPVIKEIQTISSDDWTSPSNDQSMWATEEDYQAWNADLDFFPSSAMDGRQPHKRPRNFTGDSGSSVVKELQPSRSKAIGRMFFKTKLCCKFRQGTCPYVTNCNFAHGIEELRNPPPNWQEIMAAQDDDRAQMSDQREENQIPILNSSNLGGEQRSYKGRHCKKFYTDEGCPYGDMCTFLHDEQSKARESVAISLGPTMANSYGSGSIGGNGSNQKPSNWKTRICNKWETTGYCPFGNKCHFAHGLGELHKYGGGLVETNSRDPSLTSGDTNQGGSLPRAPDGHASQTPVLHAEVSSIGLAAQRSTSINQRIGPPKPVQKWKGPDKISRIYGDWIDDIE